MHRLSEQVTRKFEEIIDVSEWQVETESGYVDIISSNKTIQYEMYKVILENGMSLYCADNHILIKSDYTEVYAINSINQYIRTKTGNSKVISVEYQGYSENMYDLSIDSVDHTFYTNDILSHNTQTSAAYILWYTNFFDSKSVAILANKASAAREVMSRYQMMFELLPDWLKQGVKTWNKGDIELENRSKVFTAATTATGIRGKTVNMLYIDETAFIPNTVAEAFFTSTFPTISSGKTTKILLSSTPQGYNHFWNFWTDAEKGKNDFVPLYIPYWEIPGRDEKWAEEQRKILGELKFTQEVLCVGGNTTVTIRDKDTGDVIDITIEKLSNLLVADKAFEILTPNGFSDFDGITISFKRHLSFTFSDNTSIQTSYQHRFIDNDKEVYASNLRVGDIVCNKIIVKIVAGDEISLYDPVNVSKGHCYYGNGLLHHNCSFLGSSLTLIPPDILAKLSPDEPLKTVENTDFYETPVPGHTYVCTVDPSKGVGGDSSIIQVIDITESPYKQVAKYRNNVISPLLLPNVIYKIAKEYNSAYVLIEINISEQVAHILHYELEYENLILINKKLKGLNRGQIAQGFGGKPALGVSTDKKVKRIGCANLKSLMTENKLLIRDAQTISEMSTFIEVRDSYQADDGYHDDLVMGLVIFAWLTTQTFFKELNNIELRHLMYETHMKRIDEELTPFGFYDDGNQTDNDEVLLNF